MSVPRRLGDSAVTHYRWHKPKAETWSYETRLRKTCYGDVLLVRHEHWPRWAVTRWRCNFFSEFAVSAWINGGGNIGPADTIPGSLKISHVSGVALLINTSP